ncbi:DNA ligase 4 isoform X3 [Anabrus simplex]|uniref:DNA ligase 4 isoform X3 n=1 Tax=Anabrus simplex TaxID=316456 RepID=UPI0035A30180
MARSIAEKILFSDLCRLCEKISSTSVKDKKVEIYKKYLNYFREYGAKLQRENPQIDVSFYPVLRLLLPQLDRERGAYGVKEHALAKIYTRILCLPKEGHDAHKLLNFRAPRSVGGAAGDFADVAYWVLKKYCPDKGDFSVEQVNSHLNNVAMHNAANDRRQMEAELVSLLQNMPATDQKWLIRMLLKDMKLGLGQNSLLRLYHPDARELYDVCNNLEKICRVLRDPSQRLHEVEVEIFSPFRPMLAEQCDVQKVDDFLKHHPFCYVETKYDGERFQLHYKDGTFKYFSRNGYEYTDTYGQTAFNGLLSPHIAKQLRADIHTCILDGEMMVWDSRKKFFRPKGENIEVKSLKPDGYYRPCFCVFDILLLNDSVLTNKPLEERMKYLENVFTDAEGVILHSRRKKVTTRDEVMDELNSAIDDKLEGIVLKQPGTVYKPNSRKAGWFKIKPEYTDGLMDHIDAIIMGGYYGEGRRSGYISHFLVGLAAPKKDKDGNPVEFHSMCRVGSGYSMSKLEELLLKLAPHWQRVKLGQTPPGLLWTKEKPDLWIEPCKSYILQIKATEIVRSKVFKLDYTLRFPRVEDIRYDKNWNDCMTTEEFDQLRQLAEGKLYSRHVEPNDSSNISPRKRRQVASLPLTLASQFCSADLSQVERTSNFLNQKEFCVITGCQNLSKQDIEKKIHQHGGLIVANPGPKTFCVVSDECNLRVSNIAKTGQHDVAHVDWLLRSLDQGILLPWTPTDLISASSDTRRKLNAKYDKYDDSYTIPATIDTLKHSMAQVEKLVNDPTSKKVDDLELVALDFIFYGGVVREEIDDKTTHVILHTRERFNEIQEVNNKRQRKFHIVTQKWVTNSVKQQKRLKEELHSFNCEDSGTE